MIMTMLDGNVRVQVMGKTLEQQQLPMMITMVIIDLEGKR